jgi:3-hydroxyisobutyrate dehydrogenase-like beta-hydroxyacid dehydrogenase
VTDARPGRTIAFIGTGLMGTPLVKRMLDAGFVLRVWNRTPSKLKGLTAAGAFAARTVAEACDGADTICTCLSNAEAVEQTVFGSGGAAAALRAPALLIDFSTIGPEATVRYAARLATTTGASWIDAPVSGGPTGAATGTLVIFCGGAAEAVARAQPLFEVIAQRVTHFGDIGTGQVAKLCNQVIVAVALAAIAESLALAENASLDPMRLVDALTGGYADSIPLQIFGRRMASRALEPKLGEIATMAKDIALAADLAAKSGSSLPIVAAAAATYEAAARAGFASQDLSALIQLHAGRGDAWKAR